MRVFIGLTEVAGYFGSLAQGLREIGIETTFVDLYAHPFNYDQSDGGRQRLVDLYRLFGRRRSAVPVSRSLSTVWWAYLQKVCVLGILLKAVLTCDAFIFSSDTTFLRYLELPILRLLRKRLIFVFTGSDHRPPYLNGGSIGSLDDLSIAGYGEQARQVKAKVLKIERLAHVSVGHHLSAHFHERPFVPFLLLGFPFASEWGPQRAGGDSTSGAVRIVHAPSRPRQKGTAEIREAIAALRARGRAIEFVELIGQPNRVVLDELSRCDFVIDELYSDTRMAGLATEAAFLGKPAVVGGYARDQELAIADVLPASELPPVQSCHPDRLEQAIEQLIADVPYRLELGERARQFVTTHWTPRKVAERYVALIRDEIPDAWMFDPRQIRYLSGTGMPESVARAGVRRIVEMLGIDALRLHDKPELECAFLAFADGEGT